MFKLKLNLTCSYCSKIFKDPIELPCEENICREHLSEQDVVKENKLECKDCKQVYQVKDTEFKSNKAFKKLVASQTYLTDEEISLKQEMEVLLRKFFQFYDEFIQSKTQLESNVFNHFQEIRFQIDEQREKLKEKIDNIALAMIDETKKYEEIYLNNLKENLFETPYFNYKTQSSLEIDLNQLEDTFRKPNLQIETIKEMLWKQKKNINDIRFKLNELDQVKDELNATNVFKPNLTLFNQEVSSFGLLKLNANSNMNLSKSQILNGEQQASELIKLCEFSSSDKWLLLYRGTRDGFGARDFHSKCDGHWNTLTILKAKQSFYVFGGFTLVDWISSNCFKSDPNAFIFSLTNKDKKPLKMKVDLNRHLYAIRCQPEYGPIFGGGFFYDIFISNNANTTMDSYSNLGDFFKHPQYAKGTNEAQTFLAGSYKFQLDEIEVYQKE
jgi:hypothetical protein